MPAYNPPQQILFQPVTNFYRGKAIRQELKAGEINIKIKEKALKQADDKFDLEKKRTKIAEDELELREEAYRLNREKFENEVGKERASKAAFDIYSITQEVDELFQGAGKTPEAESEALELAAVRFTEYADSLPDGESKDKLLEMLQNGVTTEEYQAIRLASEREAKYYGLLDTIKPTSKMIEGASLGLAPGTPEWEEWIRGTGEGNKPLAIEVKLQLAKDVMNKSGQYEGISDEEQAAYMAALGMQSGPKGSVTLSWDQAHDIADDIVNRTDIGENFFGWDDEAFNDRLTFSLMRLAKDGRFGGNELYERAIVEALGGDYEEMLEATKETGEDGKPIATMAELIDALASLR